MLGELDGRPILASETCALDIIGARFVRDVENGEIVVISEDGHREPSSPSAPQPARPCIFEYIYFARPDSVVARPPRLRRAQAHGRASSPREAPVDADVVVPVPDSGVPAAHRLRPGSRHPVRARHHPQPLCRPHLHPADAVGPRARRAPEAQRQPRRGRGQAHRADRRFHRARHHVGEDRADDARGRRAARCISASPRPPITHPDYYGIDTPERDKLLAAHPYARGDAPATSAATRSPSCRSTASTAPWATSGRNAAAAAIHRPLLHRRLSDPAHRPDRRRPQQQLSLLADRSRADHLAMSGASMSRPSQAASRSSPAPRAASAAPPRSPSRAPAPTSSPLARTQGALEELDDEIRALGGSGDAGAARPRRTSTRSTGSARRSTSAGASSTSWSATPRCSAPISPLGHVSPKAWDKVMAVNVTANWRLHPLARPAAARLRRRPRDLHHVRRVPEMHSPIGGPTRSSKAALDALGAHLRRRDGDHRRQGHAGQPGPAAHPHARDGHAGRGPDDAEDARGPRARTWSLRLAWSESASRSIPERKVYRVPRPA